MAVNSMVQDYYVQGHDFGGSTLKAEIMGGILGPEVGTLEAAGNLTGISQATGLSDHNTWGQTRDEWHKADGIPGNQEKAKYYWLAKASSISGAVGDMSALLGWGGATARESEAFNNTINAIKANAPKFGQGKKPAATEGEGNSNNEEEKPVANAETVSNENANGEAGDLYSDKTEETKPKEEPPKPPPPRINQDLIDAVVAKAKEIVKNNPSKKDRGPCLTGIFDPATGKTFFDQNFKNTREGYLAYKKWLTDPPEKGGADPIIKDAVAEYEAKIKKREIENPEWVDRRTAAHSEIRAYDQALKARRAENLPVDKNSIQEMDLHNRDLWNLDENGIPKPKPRCPHCGILTDGINIHGHN